jgi:hypothetical protein
MVTQATPLEEVVIKYRQLCEAFTYHDDDLTQYAFAWKGVAIPIIKVNLCPGGGKSTYRLNHPGCIDSDDLVNARMKCVILLAKRMAFMTGDWSGHNKLLWQTQRHCIGHHIRSISRLRGHRPIVLLDHGVWSTPSLGVSFCIETSFQPSRELHAENIKGRTPYACNLAIQGWAMAQMEATHSDNAQVEKFINALVAQAEQSRDEHQLVTHEDGLKLSSLSL